MEGYGITTFYFDNIFLPAASADEPGSHGFVKYAVKCWPSLTLGTAVENKAYIYFDFNLPILTNTATTLIAIPPINISTGEIILNEYMSVYPNPVSDVLNGTIQFENLKSYQLVIYNQQGKLIKSEKHNNKHFTIDVSNEANGLYLGKIVIPETNNQLLFKFIISH